MHSVSALAVARMLTAASIGGAGAGGMIVVSTAEDIPFGSLSWYLYAGISCVLVLFAGIMSGLTLGLMSLGLVELEILQRSGSNAEKAQAAAILPVVQKQHQLLVTLLLCNAAAMEALPIFLDKIFHPVVAVILSVTFVLTFGEVIPQAICSRYGLAVGANLVWLVRILMVVCYPVAWPIGKLLDWALGHNDSALFRRAQLKALVTIHSKEEGKGGELTHDETTIISGALDLTEKTAEAAMTPIESTFSLDVDSKLDWEAIGKILARGHSRVPVYSGNSKNIIGLLLVKSLLTVRAETETPVSAVSIRRIPRVPADMPLYDILNEFQKGSSHMAAVVRPKSKALTPTEHEKPQEKKEGTGGVHDLSAPLLVKTGENESVVVDMEKLQNNQTNGSKVTANAVVSSQEDIEEGEVIGIITLEDVFEELLQGTVTSNTRVSIPTYLATTRALSQVFRKATKEEIVDETDEFVDVHKRIRVAAAAAASSVARAPSVRRLNAQRAAQGTHNKPGHSSTGTTPKHHNSNITEPLLGGQK